jgi:outer membrane receptor protein involved in Fe transport
MYTAFILSAQTVVQGKVKEGVNHQVLEFATVSIADSTGKTITGITTDPEGNFIIENLYPGNFTVRIEFIGFDPSERKISLTRKQRLDLGTIELKASRLLLDELVITGEKAAAVHKLDRQIYNSSQFQSAQGGTATDLIRNLPSVSVNNEGEITVRGTSGFQVMVDGKPLQADPSVILNQLPANTIDNIEIITTPSSKYDPDGKGGIVNIVTKKGFTDGLYLNTNLQGGLPPVEDYGNDHKPVRYAADVTANYKKNSWNLSFSGNYKRDDLAGYRVGESETVTGNIFTTNPSVGERSYRVYSWGLKGSATYTLNKSTSFDAGFYGGKKSQFRTANLIYNQQRYDVTTGRLVNRLDYYNKNLRERKGDFAIFNAGFSHKFSNQALLSASALYEKTILGGPTDDEVYGAGEGKSQTLYAHSCMDEKNPLDGFRFKTDFSRPAGGKGKLEAGYQYRFLLHRGDFTYYQENLNTGNLTEIPEFSNNVKLQRHIHALYGLFTNEWKKLSYSAGLRAEYTDRKLEDKGSPAPYLFNRLSLFPSANLLLTLPSDFRLKAGYSRRINHTTSNMMNPFMARRHSEVFEVGDPALLPEFINLTEIGIIREIRKNTLTASLYHQGTRNVINRVNSIWNDTILIRTFTNAGRSDAYGLETGFDLKPVKWWSIFAGGNLFYYQINGTVMNRKVDTHSLNYLVKVNSTFRITPEFTAQLTVNYTSPTVTAQGEDSDLLLPSATIRKTLLKGKASVSLQWSNIDLGLLKSNEQVLATRGPGFYSATNYIQEVDVFRLNLSYQISGLTGKLRLTESEFGEKEF